jgi:hypothetical protein
MTTSANAERENQPETRERITSAARALFEFTVVRELSVFLTFFAFTSILTWPYINYLRNVVVDKGDPYLCAWILWWDFHQTFTDPLNLFHSNTFYPLKYTLAFSEHGYGISLLMFPFYAIGLQPLTVHAIAMFLGFVLSGYAAFRLARTLTGSNGVAWVSGIVFAFVPYRFHLMSQVFYLFSPWIPLVFEAFVLFVRQRSKRRALWLGIAFFMLGITTLSWLIFTLIPFVIFAAFMLTRYDLWREREFWLRGAVALFLAGVALLPFTVPYVLVSRLYGLKRSIEEVKSFSALPVHWLSVENRNKLWNRLGEGVFEGYNFKLFPGLLPILFSLAAFRRDNTATTQTPEPIKYERWLPRLDALIVVLLALSFLAIGFDRTDGFFKIFDNHNLTSERALFLLSIAVFVRLFIAYPTIINAAEPNLFRTLRSRARSDAFWLGCLLTAFGFLYSLGWNFFLYRICYDLLPVFRSMRVPTRGAILAYLGFAILAGLGVRNLAPRVAQRFPRITQNAVYVIACALLLFELNGAPLRIELGEVSPDAVTLRLKETPMRGGIVELPAGGDNNYRYMLRAADHQKPLIVSTSGFISPIENQIENFIFKGPITDELMNLMESVPTSYLVICNKAIPPERTADYQFFLARQLSEGRLRFINRFDGRDDLYAVVKNEPDAKTEAALPFDLSFKDWAVKIQDDPVVLLGSPLEISRRLFRFYVATTGQMPRYDNFKNDIAKISRGVVVGAAGNDDQFDKHFREFVDEWSRSKEFNQSFGELNDNQYVNQLIQNSAIDIELQVRDQLIGSLSNKQDTRAGVVLKIVDHPRFVEKERNRSLVALHYFGYLRRNPDDPPDGDLRGFNFWLNDIEHNDDPNKLPTAFRMTDEYKKYAKQQ